ncbi:hypothetical protein P3X46_016094 [Hevea brasiliensis]|uniref:Exopolygalacturonase-like n=1 Tax=Hevea brasiliensis TaxID=3981 RepID=A0ABQ9LY67_HEVBR|nr:exopolygalacturonase-like [Hevea brasiliensis]KAJ9172901.1 hypothetical protein P3X46_016094 [Hevea brasiliensis]
MNLIMNSLSIFLLLSFAFTIKADLPGVFNVKKYGAKSDGSSDISQALLSAWKEACAATGSTIVFIQKGDYALRQVDLVGPCKGDITFKLEGTLKAPTNPGDLGGDCWVRFRDVDGLKVSGGGTFDGQGEVAWKQNNCAKTANCKALPMNIRFDFVTNAMIQDITSLDSKNFHINVMGCKNITFKHVTITAPEDSANTDGIHMGRCNGVNIIDTNIGTGDDCISIGDGSQQVTISGVTCGPGHGISVGSLGKYKNEEPVVGIFVKSCQITSTSNGVRIKSWPGMYAGTASDIHFEDITMKNVSNPVLIDQTYCPWGQCNEKATSNVKLSEISFKRIKGTSATALAVKLACSRTLPCEKVELGDIDLTYSGNEGPAKSECTNVKPIVSGKLNPPGC